MKELERHIEVLLLDHDCVIVPSLGGFVAHHVAAHYDDRDHSFIPPTRTLGFNPKLVINDSLLVQSYVDAYDISYPEALKHIEAEVSALKRQLSETGEYDFSGLGRLAYNEEGHLLFEPYNSGILSPSLYGLGLLEFERISTPIFQLTNASQHLSSSSERVVTIKVKTLRKMAVAAVALLGFFLFANPFSGHHQGSSTEATFMGGLFTGSSHSTEVVRPAQQMQSTNASETQMEEIPVAQEDYQIVLACRLPKSNAQLIVEELKADGFSAVLSEVDGDVKVLYGHYASQSEAYQELQQLSSHKYFNSAWILKTK